MASSRNILKKWFLTGLKPSQGQFAELINSFFNFADDSIQIPDVVGLPQALAGKATAGAIMFRDYANIAARDAETNFSNLKFAFVVDASADPNVTAPYALYYRYKNAWYFIPGVAGVVPPAEAFTYTLPFTLS